MIIYKNVPSYVHVCMSLQSKEDFEVEVVHIAEDSLSSLSDSTNSPQVTIIMIYNACLLYFNRSMKITMQRVPKKRLNLLLYRYKLVNLLFLQLSISFSDEECLDNMTKIMEKVSNLFHVAPVLMLSMQGSEFLFVFVIILQT